MSRAVPTLSLAILLIGVLGANDAAPPPAALSAEAKQPAPIVPAPDALTTAKGFSGAALSPYRDVLAATELARIEGLSKDLFQTPVFSAFRAVVGALAAGRQRDEQYAEEFQEKEVLFTYAMPNDPSLLLGTGKSRGGKVTALPRLLAGALDAKAATAGAEGNPVFENFLLRSPEQVCTAGLSYQLNPEGSGFAGIEYMPPPLPMDDPLMHMLLYVSNNPNPISLSEEPVAVEAPAADDDSPDAAAQAADGGDDGDPSTGDRQDPYYAALAAVGAAETPIAQLAAAFAAADKKSTLGGTHVANMSTLLRALADAAPGLKRDCLAAGDKWTEAKRLGGAWNLIGCFTPKGARSGLNASADDGFPWLGKVQLQLVDANAELGVAATLEAADALVRLGTLKGEKAEKFGPEVLYDVRGPALALNFVVPSEHQGQWGEFDVFEWHDNGRLKLIGHRKGGLPVDERSYYKSGALAGHVTYEGARLTSYREWFETKFPAEETFFDKDGSMHGLRRWWHQNGRPAGELTYDHGRPDGDLAMWYDAGRLGVRARYKKGGLDGDVRWFYEDGGKLYEGRFKDDKPDGAVKLTLATGVTVSERTFKKGEPEGTWISYDAAGKPAQEFSFKNGLKDGKSVMSYPDGSIAVELVWKDGLLEGALNSFYQGGQLAATCLYDHDRLTSFQRFHRSGEQAMDGKVLDQERGSGEFTTYRVNATPVLSCNLQNWEPQGCRLFNDKGRELALPSYKALVKNIEGGATRWHPEKCGGYAMKLNFDPLIDYGQNIVAVEISTKDPCANADFAEVLYCSLSIDGGKISAAPCNVAGGDAAELDMPETAGDAPADETAHH